MRVVVLRARAERERAQKAVLVVAKVLIAEIPIQMPIDLDRQSGFRRSEVNRIRADDRAAEIRGHGRRSTWRNEASGDCRATSRIRQPIALAIVLIQAI